MEKTFDIKCTMEEKWIDVFISMLKEMEYLGVIGNTREVGIYSDGDGDFRPRFKFSVDSKKLYPYPQFLVDKGVLLYDADYDVDEKTFLKEYDECVEKKRSEKKSIY